MQEVFVAMKKIDLSRPPAVLETVDTFLAAVPWSKGRTVVIYLREHGGRRYVRLRTFNKQRAEGYWYPTKRFYMVPIESAAALGKAIIAASKGRPFGDPPEWWAEWEKDYREWQACKAAEAEGTPDVDRSDTP